MFVEYALLLAVVLFTGVAFVNHDDLPDSIKGIFTKTEQVLGIAAGQNSENNQGGNNGSGSGTTSGENSGGSSGSGSESSSNSGTIAYNLEGIRQGTFWGESLEDKQQNGFSTGNLIPLESGEYEIVFDRNAFNKAVNNPNHNYNEVKPYLVGYTINSNNYSYVLDSKSQNNVGETNNQKYALSGGTENGGVFTYTLKNTGETLNLGLNFHESNWGKNESDATLNNAIKQSLTITKK